MLAAREASGLPSAGSAGPGNRIGEIVDANPEDAAGIIRSWISEGAT
jgi:flagellar biosynthesis/type III secretory pathway M-ring protein FliF/YscJ